MVKFFSFQFKHKFSHKLWWKLSLLISSTLLLIPGGIYATLLLLRPPRDPQKQELFPGITYTRSFQSTPRSLLIHQVTIDLTSADFAILVTPGTPTPDQTEIEARTTSTFVEEFGVQLAINGAFFHPFQVNHPGDYYPREGERVNVLGQAISNGVEYSPGNPGWSVLCFLSNQTAEIPGGAFCPDNTKQAISGGEILLWEGKPVELMSGPFYDHPYPRTAIAVNQSGTQLWIIVVDGRQPFYSDGASLPELQAIFTQLGAETALNLDGGGSSTLVVADPQLRVLNAPFHTRIPLRQRPVANHLGIKIKSP